MNAKKCMNWWFGVWEVLIAIWYKKGGFNSGLSIYLYPCPVPAIWCKTHTHTHTCLCTHMAPMGVKNSLVARKRGRHFKDKIQEILAIKGSSFFVYFIFKNERCCVYIIILLWLYFNPLTFHPPVLYHPNKVSTRVGLSNVQKDNIDKGGMLMIRGRGVT